MAALRLAIDSVGGPAAAARICSISTRAVFKWLKNGHLPRTEYTKETRYAELLSAASAGRFTADWLREKAARGRSPNLDEKDTQIPSGTSRLDVPVNPSSTAEARP